MRDPGLRARRRLAAALSTLAALHVGCSHPPPNPRRTPQEGRADAAIVAQARTGDAAHGRNSAGAAPAAPPSESGSGGSRRRAVAAAPRDSSGRATGISAPPAASLDRLGPDAIDPYDAFGRLRPAKERIFGYPVPAALRVTTRRRGLVFGELHAMLRPLEEFYTHRDYLVVRKRNFFHVRPMPAALDRVPPELRDQHARSTLTIFVLAPQRFRFRFEDPDASHARISRAVAPPRRKDDVLPPRPPMVPAYDPDSPNPTRNVPPPPLNPDLPPGKGGRDVRPRIRAWKEAHPDWHFGD